VIALYLDILAPIVQQPLVQQVMHGNVPDMVFVLSAQVNLHTVTVPSMDGPTPLVPQPLVPVPMTKNVLVTDNVFPRDYLRVNLPIVDVL